MTPNLGAVLGWKFGHAPGICTVNGVITEWPESLGALPTPEQLAAWEAEYSAELTKAELIAAVQVHVDATAQAHGYDSIYTACTYADEPAVAQFQSEGQALRAWRSLVWAHCNSVLTDVMAATRPVPTAAELIAELPALVMP